MIQADVSAVTQTDQRDVSSQAVVDDWYAMRSRPLPKGQASGLVSERRYCLEGTIYSIDDYRTLLLRFKTRSGMTPVEFRALLDRAEPVLRPLRKRDLERPPSFNIFQVLGHTYREVSTHSALLAHLLDPAGSHEQEGLFLRHFLEMLDAAAEQQGVPVSRFDTISDWRAFRVSREGFLGVEGQADILIKGPGIWVIVENKIHAGDQSGQIGRYWDYLTRHASDEDRRLVVYLTLDGRFPSAFANPGACRSSGGLVCLSHRTNIHNLLMKTIGILLSKRQGLSVAEILLQYADLLRRLV